METGNKAAGALGAPGDVSGRGIAAAEPGAAALAGATEEAVRPAVKAVESSTLARRRPSRSMASRQWLKSTVLEPREVATRRAIVSHRVRSRPPTVGEAWAAFAEEARSRTKFSSAAWATPGPNSGGGAAAARARKRRASESSTRCAAAAAAAAPGPPAPASGLEGAWAGSRGKKQDASKAEGLP